MSNHHTNITREAEEGAAAPASPEALRRRLERVTEQRDALAGAIEAVLHRGANTNVAKDALLALLADEGTECPCCEVHPVLKNADGQVVASVDTDDLEEWKNRQNARRVM